MGKFIDDTLKVKGKYSMDRVLVAIAFPFMLLIGAYIVLSDRLLGLKTVNVYAIQVFTGLLGFIVAIVVTKQYGKNVEIKANTSTINDSKNQEILG